MDILSILNITFEQELSSNVKTIFNACLGNVVLKNSFIAILHLN